MIFGIGTDIVEVARIAHGMERFGERYATRILAPSELDGYREAVNPAHYLAKRFAAKEATVKAMGTGFTRGISMRDIHVHRQPGSRPQLGFSGRAAAVAGELGIGEAHLSLSDERTYALAFVTLMRA